MNIRIANMEITNEEKLYGNLLQDIEKMGYLVIEDDALRTKYIIARKEENE